MEEAAPDTANPYQSPEADLLSQAPPAAQGVLTENMLVYLKGASPWLKFLAVIGFIFAGLTAASGLIYMAFIPLIGPLHDIPGFGFAGALGVGLFVVGMVAVSLGIGALIFFPSLFLFRFGDKVGKYLRSGIDQDFEQAFKNNKSYWKFMGIIAIIYLAFVPVVIVAAIIVGIFSAFAL